MNGPPSNNQFDAIIIGGGFFGCSIATYLCAQRGLSNVLVVERESELMQRASYNNQARIHTGYHYPRSFTTAYRSRVNFPKYLERWPDTVVSSFTKLYAIAAMNSKVNSVQFERFCREMGGQLQPASQSLSALFESRLIESVYLAQEYAFDSERLAELVKMELRECGVKTAMSTTVTAVKKQATDLALTLTSGSDMTSMAVAPIVFNCTYSGVNQFSGDFKGTSSKIKHEIAEMTLLEVPSELSGLGITVMDGPFFSVMPFPPRQLHTLSHVRYTPRTQWNDAPLLNPYEKLDDTIGANSASRMLRDSSRYLPCLRKSKIVDHLVEVKTVLAKNEGDDGRPILFEKYPDLPGFFSVLGGKIDNIFDVFESMDSDQELSQMIQTTH